MFPHLCTQPGHFTSVCQPSTPGAELLCLFLDSLPPKTSVETHVMFRAVTLASASWYKEIWDTRGSAGNSVLGWPSVFYGFMTNSRWILSTAPTLTSTAKTFSRSLNLFMHNITLAEEQQKQQNQTLSAAWCIPRACSPPNLLSEAERARKAVQPALHNAPQHLLVIPGTQKPSDGLNWRCLGTDP